MGVLKVLQENSEDNFLFPIEYVKHACALSFHQITEHLDKGSTLFELISAWNERSYLTGPRAAGDHGLYNLFNRLSFLNDMVSCFLRLFLTFILYCSLLDLVMATLCPIT